jgi:hypothetical protein
MKSISYTFLAAVAAAGLALGADTATTKPVGYVTQQLAVGFNILGLTVHSNQVTSGTITAASGTTITTSTDLTAALTAGGRYLVEITDGTNAGLVIEADSWSGTNFTNVPGLPGGLANAKFNVRRAVTLESVFGTTLAQDFTANGADIVWVSNGSGGYNRYYLQTDLFGGASKWTNAANNAATPNVPLTHLDAVFVEVKASAKSLVTSGEVKLSNTSIPLGTGFSLVSLIYPAGVTLDSIGLSNFFDADFTPNGADILWVPTSPGVYTRYYRQADIFGGPSKWVITPGNTAVANPALVNLPTGVFVENKGAPVNGVLTVPGYAAN